MADSAESARPRMEAYAAERGLFYYDNWSMPEATQLLHHGFMREVPNVVMGDLPGGLHDAWLEHADYAYSSRTKIERRYFTLVLIRAEASAAFAVRVLCHDRDLSELDVSNPDAEREPVEMDDRGMVVESEAFLKRYALSTDHDQDEVRAWQLFDPALIAWLTDEAPADFSFELQDGALCCFVPGVIAEAVALDALCLAGSRVHSRVLELGDELSAAPASAVGSRPQTRDQLVEGELAKHPFARPPKSVRSAARAFGHWPFLGDAAWKLGGEAFFRMHAAELGLERTDPGAFRASHLDVNAPGAITHVARGPLPPTGLDGYLLQTTDDDPAYPDIGWTVVLADISPDDNGFAFTQLPEARVADENGYDVSSNGESIVIWKPDGGPHARNAKQLSEFLATAGPLLAKAVAAAKGRMG